jgi:hypothetical protein
MNEHTNSFKSQLKALGIDSKTKLHITHCDKIEAKITQQKNKSIVSKPFGLWYSIGFEWLDFTTNDFEGFYGEEKLYAYEINIDNLNILKLNTIEDINEFLKKYKIGNDMFVSIDWKEVSKSYDGIEINNYRKIKNKALLNFDYIWLYGWDVSSGCIWNTKNLNIKEIK